MGWPLLDQLTSGAGPSDPDGIDENRWNNCVGTALAAALQWYGLGHFRADELKDAVYGEGHTGYTDPIDYVSLLAGLGLRATPIRTDDPRTVVEDALRRGVAVAARSFEPEGYFHYCPVIALDDKSVTRHNPLGGRRETLSWDDWLHRYAGWLVTMEKGTGG